LTSTLMASPSMVPASLPPREDWATTDEPDMREANRDRELDNVLLKSAMLATGVLRVQTMDTALKTGRAYLDLRTKLGKNKSRCL
jgi:hypothetical protein